MAGGSSFHLLIVRYRLLLLLLLCPFVLAKLALEEYPEYVTRHGMSEAQPYSIYN